MIDLLTQLSVPENKMLKLGRGLTVTDLREATHQSINFILDLVNESSDAMIAFEPVDEKAHDPYAVDGEERIGWTLGHLVAHVTASSEEWAAYSSILARGLAYPREPRLRYETPWREVDTQAKAIQRLNESRRIRLAFLETWPDQPHLDTLRELSERQHAAWGDLNAPAAFLTGLRHEVGHHAQFREVFRQAQTALSTSTRS